MTNKKFSRRQGRKRALRNSDAMREPMRAGRRNYGRGEGSNAHLTEDID